MDISSLITELKKPEFPIKNRSMLTEALIELDSMIGMKELKRAVIDQLLFFLSNIRTKGIEHATDGHVLHTLIYGPPGVGKTVVGSILSRIWSSLGILGKSQPNITTSEENANGDNVLMKLLKDNVLLATKNKKHEEKIERATLAAEATMTKIRDMRSRLFAIRTRRNKQRDPSPVTLTEKELALVDTDVQKLCRISSDTLNYCSMICRTLKENVNLAPGKDPSTNPNENQKVVFKVVSRINFVAEYLGQTAVKTKKLLDEHAGGVLLVDEAYSLYQGDRDSFGSEALTVINQYMTENSDSTVLIFAGYKDVMQASIFKAQQGLIRRFGFTFDIKGYTPEEISQIFIIQLEKDSWKVSDNEFVIKFFTDNYKYFPAYGGDTKRLIFQCKIIHSVYNWNSTEINRIITPEIMNEALIRYKSNMTLDLDRMHALDLQRKYEEEHLEEKMKEHKERKENQELYDKYRQYEREQMKQKIKENEEKDKQDKKFLEPPPGMYT